jgi:GNAT superfamily N-acetyltransferase
LDNTKLTIRFAEQNDALSVTFLLKDVAQWLVQNNQALWHPDYFTVERTNGHIERSELVVGIIKDKIAASMLILKEDPEFWPEALPGEALYLHKIVVGREFSGYGLSHQLFLWAKEYATIVGAKALRLDCAPREKLVRVYEKAGFYPFDDQPVTMQGFLVKRMELACS